MYWRVEAGHPAQLDSARGASEAHRVAQCCVPQMRRWGLTLKAHGAQQGHGGTGGI